jgi:phosphoglycolate phosphatase
MLFSRRSLSLFIFDLDGTLIDSKEDIAYSLNAALARVNYPPLSVSRVEEFIGDGVGKLVERALRATTNREPDSKETKAFVPIFFEEYGLHLLDQTRLFPNTLETLDQLSWAKFAIVSNKPEGFCRRILEGLGIASKFQAILGGDSVDSRKPDPEGILRAIEICGSIPSQTMMVGDSPVDIAAGKAAGTYTCGVAGGFRSQEQLEAAQCDLLISSLADLPKQIR